MGRQSIEQPTADLFSGGNRSADILSGATAVRRPGKLVLPTDLPNSIKYLDDRELDRLLAEVTDEAKKRGRLPASVEPRRTRTVIDLGEAKPKRPRSTRSVSRKKKIELAPSPLTRGQINAVRAAFRAGITPARIARQFGLSQLAVREALSSNE